VPVRADKADTEAGNWHAAVISGVLARCRTGQHSSGRKGAVYLLNEQRSMIVPHYRVIICERDQRRRTHDAALTQPDTTECYRRRPLLRRDTAGPAIWQSHSRSLTASAVTVI
jgi:hypothetical protein